MSDLLEGIRVLEEAILLNGDSLGSLLADLGADVIKIESPQRGDYLRDMLGQITPHNSPAHVQVNKNKRSLTLDLSAKAGLEVWERLITTTDVVVDGFRAGVLDRLGVGYEGSRRHKPDIVYCHFSGFGARGPYSAIPTHGQMMNALAGATPVAMGEDGLVVRTGTNELMGGTTIGGDAPAVGALHAAVRVAAALVRRERLGIGAYLDASGADAVIATAWIGAAYGLNEDRLTDRRDLRRADQPAFSGARYQWYETGDHKFVLFCAIEPKFWERFCRIVGRDDLVSRGDRESTASGGPIDFGRDDERLRRELQAVFHTRSQGEWVKLAIEAALPIGPSHLGVRASEGDEHLRARNIFVDGEHPGVGPFTYVGEPVIVDDQPFVVRRPAPALGQHTDEILTELGYGAGEVAELRASGAV